MVSLVRSRVPGGGCFKRGLGGGWPTLRPKGFLPLRGFLDQAKSITTTVPHTRSLSRARAHFVCRRAWPGHIGPATQRQQTLLACKVNSKSHSLPKEKTNCGTGSTGK